MRDAEDDFKIEQVMVYFHVGNVHEYCNDVIVSPLYPNEPADRAPNARIGLYWPALPNFHDRCTPQQYITEYLRRDLRALHDDIFRGSVCRHVMETVKMWEELPNV